MLFEINVNVEKSDVYDDCPGRPNSHHLVPSNAMQSIAVISVGILVIPLRFEALVPYLIQAALL